MFQIVQNNKGSLKISGKRIGICFCETMSYNREKKKQTHIKNNKVKERMNHITNNQSSGLDFMAIPS